MKRQSYMDYFIQVYLNYFNLTNPLETGRASCHLTGFGLFCLHFLADPSVDEIRPVPCIVSHCPRSRCDEQSSSLNCIQVQLGGYLLVLAITLLGGFQHLPPGVNQLHAIFRSRVVICGNHGTLKEQFK